MTSCSSSELRKCFGFVERLTRVNRGRAYYTQPDKLGGFVFVDYLRNRRRRVR